MNKILAAINAHAASTPEKIALLGQATQLNSQQLNSPQLTYAQLSAQIDALADWLLAQNIGRAGLWGENSIEWIIADLAAWKANITLVPLPRFFSNSQLQHVVAQAQLPCLLVCGEIARVTEVSARKNSPIANIYLDQLATNANAPA